MRKPKVTCFCYKRYSDVYFSNVSFSTDVMLRSHVPRFLVACNKIKLHCLRNRVNMDNFEGMFIASISDDIIPEEFICSLDHTANFGKPKSLRIQETSDGCRGIATAMLADTLQIQFLHVNIVSIFESKAYFFDFKWGNR